MMIKVIIFDLSGVCMPNAETIFAERYAREKGLDVKEFCKAFDELTASAERAEITGEECWRQLLGRFGLKDDPDKLVQEMFKDLKGNPEALELAQKLRKNHKTAFLTNYSKMHWDEIKKHIDFDKYFDFGIVAYQVKARKPEPPGFLAILKHFDAKPEEAVFLDDQAKNLAEAAKLGIKTVLFKNTKQLLQDLKKLGVNIDGT